MLTRKLIAKIHDKQQCCHPIQESVQFFPCLTGFFLSLFFCSYFQPSPVPTSSHIIQTFDTINIYTFDFTASIKTTAHTITIITISTLYLLPPSIHTITLTQARGIEVLLNSERGVQTVAHWHTDIGFGIYHVCVNVPCLNIV